MKTFKIALIIIASIIGAGFASGKEIFEYFAKFGICSLLYLIPLFLCFFIFTKILLNYGSSNNAFKNKKVFIFKQLNIINVIMFCTFLIISTAMFSGLVSLFQTYFPFINKIVIFVFVCLFSWLIIIVPFKTISKTSYILVPAIIVSIIICAIFTFKEATFATNYVDTNIIPLAFKTPLYASQNLFLASFMIINIGKDLNNKEKNKVSLLVSLILCTLLGLGILCFIFYPQIAYSDMPFAEISINISPVFSTLFAFIIFFAILTTYSTTISSLKEFFNGRKKHNNHIFMLVIIALLSLIDFGTIIAYLYPVIGVFGILYIYLIQKANINMVK